MILDEGSIIILAVCWACALIFIAIALWAFKRKKPIHFWSGSTVKPEEITDVPAYNKENAIMWAVYAACFLLIGVMGLISTAAAGIFLTIVCTVGVYALYKNYKRIYNKYANASYEEKHIL